MWVGLLGPLEVVVGQRTVDVAGPLPRRLLALLATSAGRVVSVEALIDGLWPEAPPAGARQTLQSHIARLRRAIGAAAVEAAAGGYLIRAGTDDVDSLTFADRIRTALAVGAPAERAELLADSLALWRGPAYSEFLNVPVLAVEAVRLEEMRLDAVQQRWEAELLRNDVAPPVAELESWVRRHPTREGLWVALMHALYRAGRQADALAAFQRARDTLVDELGVDPGPGLQEMERRILRQDPTLLPPSPPAAGETLPAPPVVGPPATYRRPVVVLAVELPPGEPDPEDAFAAAAPLMETVMRVAADHGAEVQPPRADVVLAVFGVPVAHEDDAARAVTAATVIARELAAPSPPRFGIAAGEVMAVTGADGTTVTGPPLRTADALRARAAPGQILVDASTRELLSPGLDLHPADDGSNDAFVVVGGASTQRRGDRSPFVGRSSDRELLRAAYAKAVDERAVQVVTLVGEAGIGKSRLVEQLRQDVADASAAVRWLVGRCRPYGDATVLAPFADLVRAGTGSAGDDSDDAFRRRILASAPGMTDEDAGQLAKLTTTAVANGPDSGRLAVSMCEWLTALAAERPTVVVIEDLHWATPALLDALDELAHGLLGVPLVLLLTARPDLTDRRPGWGAGATAVHLGPLSDEAITQLVEAAGMRAAELVRRSAGIPLYAEQLASWAATGVGDVPPTLRALLHARIDSLPQDARRALEVGSVAGSVVWSDELVALCGSADRSLSPDQVEAALHVLVRRHFLRRSDRSRRRRALEYEFWHDLVRETAEARLPRHERARRHLEVARWWEGRPDAPINRVDAAAVAAFDLAERSHDAALMQEAKPLACAAAFRTGRRLQGLDTTAALRQLNRALDLCDDEELRPQIQCWLGATLHDDRQFVAAAERLSEALSSLRDRSDPLAVDAALFLMSTLFSLGRPFDPVIEVATTLAGQLPPSRAAVRNLAGLAMVQLLGQTPASLRQALETATRAITIAQEVECGGDALARVVRGRARLGLGDGDGLAELEAALHDVLRQESGTLALGTRQWLAGALHHWRGPAAELAARRELEAMAAERGLGFIVSMGVAEDVRVLCELGRYDEALALSDQALDAAEAQPRWMVVQRALALLDLGRLDDTTLRQVAATPPADPDDLRHILGTALVIAGAALGRGDVATARSTLLCLPAAQQFVDRDGAVELIPRLLRTAARAGCAELVRGVHGVDDIATPLRQAIASTVAGLRLLGEDAPVAAAPVLQEAFDRWQRLGFVAEASAVQADLQQCRRPVDR